MALARRFLVLAVLGAAFYAPTAGAYVPPVQRPSLPYTVGTTHILVHYTADPALAYHVTYSQAADLAAKAETAYNAITSWGYSPPVPDALGGDSRTDLYVVDLSQSGGLATVTFYDGAVGSSGASINVDYAIGMKQFEIATAFFNVVGAGMWAGADSWLVQSTGAWAGMKVQGFPAPDPLQIGPWNESLDCQEGVTSTGTPTQNCDKAWFNGSGESRWPFWQYIAEKYGDTFLKAVYARGLAGARGINALTAAIAAKGDTFGGVFSAWAAANMSGGYTVSGLQTLIPTPAATIKAGTIAGSNSATVTVDHLATRFVAITRGDASNTGPCYSASLKVEVTMPSGSTTIPYFWWPPDGLGKAQALTVSGTTASITVPWDTCYWEKWNAAVSVPNPSLTADSQSYTVKATMTIDASKILSAATPPGTVSMPGSVVPAPTADGPPTIEVVGPELINLSADANALRLIVTSDGPGTLQATLGSLMLGTADLRAGHNDVRFPLPANALSALRRTAATGGTLTLTPISPLGAAGAPVVRRVVIAAVPKAQPAVPAVQPKAKPKANPKSKAPAKSKKKTRAGR